MLEQDGNIFVEEKGEQVNFAVDDRKEKGFLLLITLVFVGPQKKKAKIGNKEKIKNSLPIAIAASPSAEQLLLVNLPGHSFTEVGNVFLLKCGRRPSRRVLGKQAGEHSAVAQVPLVGDVLMKWI